MKKSLVIGLALILLMSLVVTAHGAAPTDNTTATIAFTSGTLEFEDAGISGLKNMNISFGTNTFPLGAVNYYAVDGSHTLRVADPNDPALDWTVTVTLGNFTSTVDSAKTFEADIELTDPTLVISNNAGNEAGFWFEDELMIIGNDSTPCEVMSTAGGTYAAGWFDLTWAQNNIKLLIDETNALQIKDETYFAVMTWTLTLD